MNRTTENITGAQFTAVQSIYQYFNDALFGGKLNGCLLNFSRKSKAYGFFAPNRWGKSGAERDIHEISLNPEHLSRTPKAVISTLVHEMAHLWQQDFGKSSPGYHNRQWAEKMKEIGLFPSSTGAEGGKQTGKNCSHYIIVGGPYDRLYDAMPPEFIYPFVCISESGPLAASKKGKNKVKYTCTCDTNIWGKPGLNVHCPDCDEDFQEAA